MNLVIDIGNSLHKIGVFNSNDELLFIDSIQNLSSEYLKDLMATYTIKNSILSEVGTINSSIMETLQNNTRFVPFTNSLRLPIQLAYLTPESLGKDRIASSVAAQNLFPGENCLVIQAGSCIVYDFTDQTGTFQGGAISPGLNMRFQALHHQTARLPLIKMTTINYFLGKDTQQSIKSGVINGVLFEIDGQINAYNTEYKEINTLLTGGDMTYLQKSIKNQIFATPNLVLIGLNKILNLNV
jgi:type III pantothenate kinase